MVGQRSPLRSRPTFRLAPVFGFASALATFLLVLVVIGDVLGILTPSNKPVAQAPIRTSPVAVSPLATPTAGAESVTSAASSSIQAQPPVATANESANLQAPQVAQAKQPVTNTESLTLTIQSAQPFSPTIEETPVVPGTEIETETITNVNTATIMAQEATGLGGIMNGEADVNLPFSKAVLTSEGLQWKTTISVTVSPTETLTFPMTVTMEGPGVAMTYDIGGKGGGPSEEQSGILEPTSTPLLEASPAPAMPASPTETPVPTEPADSPATEAPGIVAQAVEPPTLSPTQPEQLRQAATPTQAQPAIQPVSQPARSGQAGVRIIEIVLALLALVAGFAALAAWLAKRI
jgi:hypothetical protein